MNFKLDIAEIKKIEQSLSVFDKKKIQDKFVTGSACSCSGSCDGTIYTEGQCTYSDAW